MAEPLLSDLCKICTNDTPKYCCPRCSARTCSLPCYKRHKLWAQCSGKRDPAAYVSRSQLATPAGIDHDYNFLTSIERSLATADRNIEHRGISLEGGNDAHKLNPASMLAKYLDASGAMILRAPKGMSRQKNNRTQYHPKRKCIMWTVEWVLPDGIRENAHFRENIPLADAYKLYSTKEKSSRKRKRESRMPKEESMNSGNALTRTRGSSAEVPEVKSTLNTTNDQSADAMVSNISYQANITAQGGETTTDAGDEAIVIESKHISTEKPNGPEDSLVMSDEATSGSSLSTSLHFYLHKPLTPTRATILIPLIPNDTLCVSLRGRVILEYPTIYVMDCAPSNLPDGFRLESELPKMIQELEDEAAGDGDGDAAALFAELDQIGSQNEGLTRKRAQETEWEDQKVLESLRRDLEVATREGF